MTDHDRKAGTCVSHAAAERARRPSDGGYRPRWGRTWFGSWIGRLAGARIGLRSVLPGLLPLLLAAGISSQAEAQVTTNSISPTDIYEGERLEFTLTATDAFCSDYQNGYAWFKAADGTNGSYAEFGIASNMPSFVLCRVSPPTD